MCEHSVSILAWKQILMPHFVSIVWGVLIFLAGGFSLSLLKRYLKYNLVFAFEYSFQNNKC